ncbi:MAG: hypothetical protein LBR43_01340 [Spiroplasmataceae bacterium]|nr:hypothetical protein [Spiroplasmataceae bacterium]
MIRRIITTNTKKEKVIKMSVKIIPSEYWEKISFDSDWNKKNKSNDESERWDNIFKNKEIIDSFKKFTSVDKILFCIDGRWTEWEAGGKISKILIKIKGEEIDEWFYIENPIQLTKYLRDANKIFVKNGYGKVTNKEAFEFLKTIIASEEIKATLKLTHDKFEEFFGLEEQLKEINQILDERTKLGNINNHDLIQKLLKLESNLKYLGKNIETKERAHVDFDSVQNLLLLIKLKDLINAKDRLAAAFSIEESQLEKMLNGEKPPHSLVEFLLTIIENQNTEIVNFKKESQLSPNEREQFLESESQELKSSLINLEKILRWSNEENLKRESKQSYLEEELSEKSALLIQAKTYEIKNQQSYNLNLSDLQDKVEDLTNQKEFLLNQLSEISEVVLRLRNEIINFKNFLLMIKSKEKDTEFISCVEDTQIKVSRQIEWKDS